VSKPRGDIDNPTKSPSAQNGNKKRRQDAGATEDRRRGEKQKGHANVPSKRDSSCQPGITTNARNTRVALPGMKN
jgi:hypothetical protein